MTSPAQDHPNYKLASEIKLFAKQLGFHALGITDPDLSFYEKKYEQWLDQGYHGEMAYLSKHGKKRTRPVQLTPEVKSLISVRLDYFPKHSANPGKILNQPNLAYISRYALGRDYHKLMRKKLQRLAERIQARLDTTLHYRAFVDSAPVIEKPIAEKAGLGWIAKHTNLVNEKGGSWFFLGELYTSLELPADEPAMNHCGQCTRCIDVCPTQAIIAPYQLDARLCISYLTIEFHGSIPVELRPKLGNRIYGCDDCQWVCPWNRFAQFTDETDFHPRHNLDNSKLITLFSWSETEFLSRTEGSAIRRIGHELWLRNIAIALGNAPISSEIITALKQKKEHPSELVREHVNWALTQHQDILNKLSL